MAFDSASGLVSKGISGSGDDIYDTSSLGFDWSIAVGGWEDLLLAGLEAAVVGLGPGHTQGQQ